MPYKDKSKAIENKRKWRAKQKLNGLCIYDTNPLHPGSVSLCIKCILRQREVRKKYADKCREERRCVHCGKPLHPEVDKDYKCCINCCGVVRTTRMERSKLLWECREGEKRIEI